MLSKSVLKRYLKNTSVVLKKLNSVLKMALSSSVSPSNVTDKESIYEKVK